MGWSKNNMKILYKILCKIGFHKWSKRYYYNFDRDIIICEHNNCGKVKFVNSRHKLK